MLTGLISAVVVLGLLYTAGKFCSAGQRIIESTPTQLSSRAFLDSIALLSIALAVGSIIIGINTATDTESLYPLGIGIVAFLIKATLRLVPIVFGVAAITGTVLYIISFIRYIAADEFKRGDLFLELLAINGFINSAAALPLVVYLGSLLILLLIDVIRAILRIPGSD